MAAQCLPGIRPNRKTHRCPLGAGLGLRLVVGVADDTLERLAVLRGRLLEGLLQLLAMLDLGAGGAQEERKVSAVGPLTGRR